MLQCVHIPLFIVRKYSNKLRATGPRLCSWGKDSVNNSTPKHLYAYKHIYTSIRYDNLELLFSQTVNSHNNLMRKFFITAPRPR